MIVLDPERRVRLLEAQQRLRHEGVDFAIGGIIVLRGAGSGSLRANAAPLPQRRILQNLSGIVAAVNARAGMIQHRQRAGAQRLDLGERLLLRPVADSCRWNRPRRSRRNSPPRANNAAARPPVMGSWRFGARHAVRNDNEIHRAPPDWARVLTTIHQIWFLANLSTHENETKIRRDRAKLGRSFLRRNPNAALAEVCQQHCAFAGAVPAHTFRFATAGKKMTRKKMMRTVGLITPNTCNLAAITPTPQIIFRSRFFRHPANAPGMRARRSARRNGRRRPCARRPTENASPCMSGMIANTGFGVRDVAGRR